MWEEIKAGISHGDIRSLARCISLIENEVNGYDEMLQSLPLSDTPVIGITGPPGAGKSTLTDALTGLLIASKKKVAVLCVDPSSPFNLGALLGDRIRMSQWYNNPNVFIRSLASRGSLGGLHPKIIEICDLLKSFGFDYIIVETVGIGQSEIEIAGLADVSIVTLVPEAGDEIQMMKSGVMEIADIFVINKADRPGADTFLNNLKLMSAPAFSSHESEVQIIKTIASQHTGIEELFDAITLSLRQKNNNMKKNYLLTERAWQLLQKSKMKNFDKVNIFKQITEALEKKDFNLYKFVNMLQSTYC